MTIGHPPQREERILKTLSCPRNPNPVAQCFKDFFLYFISFYFQFPNNSTHHFEPTVNHLYEENPSLCSTLEPLYCNSHATTVGGIRFINIVDFGIPYCDMNHSTGFSPTCSSGMSSSFYVSPHHWLFLDSPYPLIHNFGFPSS